MEMKRTYWIDLGPKYTGEEEEARIFCVPFKSEEDEPMHIRKKPTYIVEVRMPWAVLTALRGPDFPGSADAEAFNSFLTIKNMIVGRIRTLVTGPSINAWYHGDLDTEKLKTALDNPVVRDHYHFLAHLKDALAYLADDPIWEGKADSIWHMLNAVVVAERGWL